MDSQANHQNNDGDVNRGDSRANQQNNDSEVNRGDNRFYPSSYPPRIIPSMQMLQSTSQRDLQTYRQSFATSSGRSISGANSIPTTSAQFIAATPVSESLSHGFRHLHLESSGNDPNRLEHSSTEGSSGLYNNPDLNIIRRTVMEYTSSDPPTAEVLPSGCNGNTQLRTTSPSTFSPSSFPFSSPTPLDRRLTGPYQQYLQQPSTLTELLQEVLDITESILSDINDIGDEDNVNDNNNNNSDNDNVNQ